MQFQQIKARTIAALGSGDELVTNHLHIGAGHCLGRLIFRGPGLGGGGQNFPIPIFQRGVHFFPTDLGRSFGAGMTQLQGDPGGAFLMHEINDPFPGGLLFVGIQTGTAGRNAPFRRHAGHFGIDQTGPAQGATGVMGEMPIGRHPVDGLVLCHGGDNDAVHQFHAAQLEGHEHRGTG